MVNERIHVGKYCTKSMAQSRCKEVPKALLCHLLKQKSSVKLEQTSI